MRVHVGTSGFSFPEWRGSFYPTDLPAAQMLRYYSERLKAVEINNTFYRMPSEKLLASWSEEVPPDFRFVLKASRRITHIKRLKEAGDEVAYFFRTAASLGERLGPTLVQLPPNLKKDLPRLEAFLETLPAGARAAFEFRHATWFDDDVFSALRTRGAALCVAEDEGLETPMVVTTDEWGYLRLRRQDYTDADLARKAEELSRQPWSEVFVFFKHEEEGRGPVLAARFVELVGAAPTPRA